MKPCPFCGSEDVMLDGINKCSFIACMKCDAEGPIADEEEAAALWEIRADSKPRPWLRAEEVKEPGWYWHAPGDLTMHARRAIEPNGGKGLIVLIGHFYAPIGKCRHAEGCTCALGGLWQRIPEPELPKE